MMIAAATAATGAILGFVHAQGASVHFLAIKVLDHGGKGLVIDFDETEAAGTTRLAVVDQRYGMNRAVLAEQFLDIVLGRAEGQVAHVNLLHSIFSKCRLTGLSKRSESPASSS